MSHKTFQQQWVLDPVWAEDANPKIVAAVRELMRGDSNGAARKFSLGELSSYFMPDEESSEEENAENLEYYKDHKIVYDYIKSVAPDLEEHTTFLVFNWW